MRTKVTTKGVRSAEVVICSRTISGFAPEKTEEKFQLAMLWTEKLAPVLGQKPSKGTVISLWVNDVVHALNR